MIKIGLDTESLHLWFQNKRMDIFGFIEKAHELGFDGVMIKMIILETTMRTPTNIQ